MARICSERRRPPLGLFETIRCGNAQQGGEFGPQNRAAASLAAAPVVVPIVATAPYAVLMPSCISGTERSRRPGAAKTALSTAGAATDTVGSPTPPQKPPDGMMTTSTGGISRIRREL